MEGGGRGGEVVLSRGWRQKPVMFVENHKMMGLVVFCVTRKVEFYEFNTRLRGS